MPNHGQLTQFAGNGFGSAPECMLLTHLALFNHRASAGASDWKGMALIED